MQQAEVQNTNRRKPRKTVEREPIVVSISEALEIVPVGRSTLFELLKDGTIKSRKIQGVRCIDYRSLKETFAPAEMEGAE